MAIPAHQGIGAPVCARSLSETEGVGDVPGVGLAAATTWGLACESGVVMPVGSTDGERAASGVGDTEGVGETWVVVSGSSGEVIGPRTGFTIVNRAAPRTMMIAAPSRPA